MPDPSTGPRPASGPRARVTLDEAELAAAVRRVDERTREGLAPSSIVGATGMYRTGSVLRAQAEVYAEGRSEAHFVNAFVKAWAKVMNADRFDLATDSAGACTVAARTAGTAGARAF